MRAWDCALVGLSKALIQVGVRSFNRKLAALRHGIAGIHGQVDDDLLDLPTVGLDPPQVGLRNRHQLDVLADEASEHFLQIRDHRIQFQYLGSENLASAEGQQLAREARRPLSALRTSSQ